MSFYEGTKTENHPLTDPEHGWIVDIDVIVGQQCCHGPMFRPRKVEETHDLSEVNEDYYVKLAEEAVRQAFDSARKYGRMHRIEKGVPIKRPTHPPGEK